MLCDCSFTLSGGDTQDDEFRRFSVLVFFTVRYGMVQGVRVWFVPCRAPKK